MINPIPGKGGGKFTLTSEILLFMHEDDVFWAPNRLTFNFYVFDELCEDFKAIAYLEKKLWTFGRT